MDKRCTNCWKYILQPQSDGSSKHKCLNDVDGSGVNGFFWCLEFRPKCEKCVDSGTESWNDPCFVCCVTEGYPNYQKDGAENV